jgi:hypothetical protein
MVFHVAALFTHNESGDLQRVNEPNGQGGIAPRVFLGVTSDGVLLRFREDVDAQSRRELIAAVGALGVQRQSLTTAVIPEALCSILERRAPVARVECGPAFICPNAMSPTDETVFVTSQNASCLEPLFPDWLGDVTYCQPIVALVRDGVAMSLCASVRITAHAHEAGVDTAPSARGHGYAPIVVSAWAAAVGAAGCLPLYSTSWENAASRAVARKLGLIQFGNDLHIT